MKKSLIALAVLAASGAAMAQSSVTLYGIADVWVGSLKSETAGGVSSTTTLMHSGGVSTSRWGMKGTEDLGGGLKANFQLESAVNIDSGDSAGFKRQAWVGFAGGFGDVRLGLVSSPFDNVQAASNAVFDSDLSPVNNPGGLKDGSVFRTANGYVGKPANTIFYKTPSFSGFGAEVSYSLDEKVAGVTAVPAAYSPVTGLQVTPAVAAVTAGVAIASLNLTYANGPLAAQFAYQVEDAYGVDVDRKFARLGASYNFGVATAKATYGRVENVIGKVGDSVSMAGASTDEWQVGVDVPVSSALTVSGSYAMSIDDDINGIGEVERKGFGLAAAYSLSKRTTVYGGLKMVTDDKGHAANVDTTAYAVGVRHAF